MVKVNTAKIAELMKKTKLTVNELSKKAGLSLMTTEEIVKGIAKTPTDLDKIATALGIPGKGNTLKK